MPQKERRGNWHGVRNREAAATQSSYKSEAMWWADTKAAVKQKRRRLMGFKFGMA